MKMGQSTISMAEFAAKPSGKRTNITVERSTMLLMGKSTISTGPFSMSQTVSLPEGKVY